jgi:DNA-binding IclR family transcriptional regulator
MSGPEQSVNEAKKSRNKSAVPSVEKALDVLELLSEHRDGMTMNELVDVLDRTMGEIYRVVLYLAERGFLEQDSATARYSLTLRLFELSHRHPPTERLLRAAVPLLERISAFSEQSCHLGVLNRSNVLILASVASPRPAGYSVRTGAMFHAPKTSTGMVILANSSSATQRRFLDRLTKGDRGEAYERLAKIAGQGFEDRESEIVRGVRNLSAPVFDTRGIACAITCGYIEQDSQKTSPEKTLELIRDNAEQLSRSLGFVPGNGSS